MNNITNINHDKYLNTILPLLDIHNLGMTLLQILSYANIYIDNKYLIDECKKLGLNMISFDIFNHINSHKSKSTYKKILEK